MERVSEYFYEIGFVAFFVTPINLAIAIFAIAKLRCRRMGITSSALSVFPWLVYGGMRSAVYFGFGPEALSEDATFGEALSHAFAVTRFVAFPVFVLILVSYLSLLTTTFLIYRWIRDDHWLTPA